MQGCSNKLFSYPLAFIACSMMALTSGCASGGYKLTRQYAGWVNSQSLIIRIILYILTAVVFAVTLLIDAVIFNTMDFWEGRVSAGDYEFKEGGKTYQAHHEIKSDGLKKSTIRVFGADGKLKQNVVLAQTVEGQIEMFVDGKLRTRVRDLTSTPIASIFDANGKLVEDSPIRFANSAAR